MLSQQTTKDLQARLLDNDDNDDDAGTIVEWIDDGSKNENDPSETPKEKETSGGGMIQNRFAAILLYGLVFHFNLTALAIPTARGFELSATTIKSMQQEQQQEQRLRNHGAPPLPLYNHDDRETDSGNEQQKQQQQQRIVILAGFGSNNGGETNLLQKVYEFAGQTTWLDPSHKPAPLPKLKRSVLAGISSEESGLSADPPRKDPWEELKPPIKYPFPEFSEWSFPVGAYEETPYFVGEPSRFHDLLAKIIDGDGTLSRWFGFEDLASAASYYRDLLALPWSEGSSLVVGTDKLAALVKGLPKIKDDVRGEARHVDPHADEMLCRLMEILPSSNKNENNNNYDHIEVRIDYRSRPIEKALDVWRRFRDDGESLREFLASDYSNLLNRANGLALALQFVRRGLRVTLVDADGAKAFREVNNKDDSRDHFVSNDYDAVVACDIFRLAPTKNIYCDDKNRLHRTSVESPPKPSTVQEPFENRDIDLTRWEIEHIGAIIEEYDCGIWKYLRAYQTKGLLRISYPSENLFDNCRHYASYNNDDLLTLSFSDMTKRIKDIVSVYQPIN